MSNIHPTSIIHDGCEIDQNVSIGAIFYNWSKC